MLASILKVKKTEVPVNVPNPLSVKRQGEMERLFYSLSESHTGMKRIMDEQIKARDLVTASLKEFIGGVNRVVPYSEEISSISARITSVVESGAAASGDIRSQVDEIRESNQKAFSMNENVKKICQGIIEINQEIEVVASWTNHLALKAAIEAAQAGSLGSGFTVVAKEMRVLATKANKAVKDIGGLLDRIKKETETISRTVDQGRIVIDESIVIMEKIKAFFHGTERSVRDIVDEIKEVALLVEKINGDTDALTGARQGVEKKRGNIQSAMEKIKECSAVVHSFINDSEAKELSSNCRNVAREISGAIKEIQKDMEQQVRSRERVSSILNGIFAEVEPLENKISILADNSRKRRFNIINGRDEINKIQESMSKIKHLSDQSINKINVLSGCSRQIGDFARLIAGIASQTNFLALNAAVESARGGQQGLGFVVIAEEVMKLSGRAALAVKEMENLASQVLEEIPQMILYMNEDTQKVKNGLAVAERLDRCFSEIGESAEDMVKGLEAVNHQVKGVAEMMLVLADARAVREQKRIEFVELAEKLNAEISCHL